MTKEEMIDFMGEDVLNLFINFAQKNILNKEEKELEE